MIEKMAPEAVRYTLNVYLDSIIMIVDNNDAAVYGAGTMKKHCI
ncbi:MAG: hypothetical protein ABIA63_11810 [bacterium]